MTNEFVLQTFKAAFIAVIPLSNAETALDRIDRGQTEDRRRIDKRQTKNRQRPERGQTVDRQRSDRGQTEDIKKTEIGQRGQR